MMLSAISNASAASLGGMFMPESQQSVKAADGGRFQKVFHFAAFAVGLLVRQTKDVAEEFLDDLMPRPEAGDRLLARGAQAKEVILVLLDHSRSPE